MVLNPGHDERRVQNDQTMMEQPLSVDPLQFALVSTGRRQFAGAVHGDDVREVAGGLRRVAVHGDRHVGNDVPKLHAPPVQGRETFGKRPDSRVTGVLADRGTVQRPVLGEAGDNCLDVSGIQRCRIAYEQVVDRETVFDRNGHEIPPGCRFRVVIPPARARWR